MEEEKNKMETIDLALDQKGVVTPDQKEDCSSSESIRADGTKTTTAIGGAGVPPAKEKTMTKAIWLACFGLCLAYTTSFQQNACTSAIVKHIDAELGPTTYYNWIISAYTITVSVSLPLAGGLSDIFGRKGFFIVGCLISLIGTVVALAAKTVPTVIAGMVLKGVGSGSQQLALAAVAELVPNKHRGHAQAALDIVTLPWSVFGALIGNAMVKFQSLSFRINFIIGVILNVLTIIAIYLWYHPPPGRRVEGKTRLQQVLDLDWVGVFLMAVGIVLTLMGLAFGGDQFPWKHAGVIAPIVLGCLSLLALGIWEWKFARNPFFAHELFIGKARTFSLLLVLTFVGGMALYSASAFWTQQVQGMWNTDPVVIGSSAMPGGFGGAVGGFLGGMLMGKHKIFRSRWMLAYGSGIKLIADGMFTTMKPSTFQFAMGAGFIAMFGMGFMLVALIVCTQLACQDEHIGLATLVLGSVRAIGGSVAVTIFSTIIHNTVNKDAPPRIIKAIAPLGVPPTSYEGLIKLVIGGQPQNALKLPGVTEEVVKTTRDALKWTWTLCFQRIFYTAIAFSVIALVAALFVKDVSHNMTDSVAVRLTNEEGKKETEKEGLEAA